MFQTSPEMRDPEAGGDTAAPVLVCPANISEGRRPEVVSKIAAAARRPGALLLDVHSDPDHNRSVLTFAGSPDALVESMVAATSLAAGMIDLGGHQGMHPRMGAVDVIPFVPLQAAGMPPAVAAARECARRIWEETGVPCFLYEEATLPGGPPRSLPEVRRRAFGELAPDFGGARPHPTAGGVAVGARETLVAYNVDLATEDVAVARRIARAIRERDGGLPHVRALPLSLPSRNVTQVSTNLTRPAVTPIGVVFDAVAKLAAAEGVRVSGSEIVGLTPRAALPPSPAHLMLTQPPKILEDEVARLVGAF